MSTPSRTRLRAAAVGKLRTLQDESAPAESRRNAATQLRHMGFRKLAEQVDIVPREAKAATLQALGREAVADRFEKDRFTPDKRLIVHQPRTQAVRTGEEVANLLDRHKKPDDRARLLVATPRVAQVQLGTDTGTSLAAVTEALCGAEPPFAEVPFQTGVTFTSRQVDVAGRSLTVVRSTQEVGRLARQVLLTDDASAPKLHGQVVQLFERSYTAVDQEWAGNYVGDVATPAGELALNRLLEAGDPEIAVYVGGMVWMSQQVRPLQPV